MPDVIPVALQPFSSSRVREMPDNQIVTVADLARHDDSVVRLWIGEGDLPTPTRSARPPSQRSRRAILAMVTPRARLA